MNDLDRVARAQRLFDVEGLSTINIAAARRVEQVLGLTLEIVEVWPDWKLAIGHDAHLAEWSRLQGK